MTGYTRQSSSDIVPTAVVRAAPVNAEFNTLRDAFAFSTTGNTGHKHDGSSDEGSYVPLIADLEGLNKVEIDTLNNRVSFSVEISSSAVEQIRVEDGIIYPAADNDIDLGSPTLEFKNLYLDGVANIDNLKVDAVSSDVLPISNNTYDLGSPSFNWSHIYSDNITVSTVTVTSSVDMDGNQITNMGDPTSNQDAATKSYVDGILGPSVDAAESAAAAAEAAFESFDDRYLGAKASDPDTDNDGEALVTGAIYWNTAENRLKIYDGSSWLQAAFDITGVVILSNWTLTESGGALYFSSGGVNYMKLDSSGNLQVAGDVDTNATIS